MNRRNFISLSSSLPLSLFNIRNYDQANYLAAYSFIFAAVKLILHFSTNTLWSLHRDALLYLALGRHLDWGYASVPPSIAFFSWISSKVLGGSIFAIRLFPTLIST
ncbi:MAG: hypothetical protein IPL46_00075 [Saprospiraceae bacterium]|nr:hypothetical protein [Saprospiraceae bacterium]